MGSGSNGAAIPSEGKADGLFSIEKLADPVATGGPAPSVTEHMADHSPDAPEPEKTLCEICGAPHAEVLGGRIICTACYVASGSCCTEFQEEDEDATRIKRIARLVARQDASL